MINLAHKEDCDTEIRRELKRAKIPIVKINKSRSDVPYSIYGQLGAFEFHRYWYYWSVVGPVPLNIAKKLYEDPVGRIDIRVAGHCSCPPPEYPWVDFYDEEGRKLYDFNSPDYKLPEEKLTKFLGEDWAEQIKFVENPEKVASRAFVNNYHIDTEVGLRIFVDTLKEDYRLE